MCIIIWLMIVIYSLQGDILEVPVDQTSHIVKHHIFIISLIYINVLLDHMILKLILGPHICANTSSN